MIHNNNLGPTIIFSILYNLVYPLLSLVENICIFFNYIILHYFLSILCSLIYGTATAANKVENHGSMSLTCST
uniref:Uncharacterized protein n=1 Tax=Glycine max TaxID=3847 RepID=K7L6N2_SOYBN